MIIGNELPQRPEMNNSEIAAFTGAHETEAEKAVRGCAANSALHTNDLSGSTVDHRGIR